MSDFVSGEAMALVTKGHGVCMLCETDVGEDIEGHFKEHHSLPAQPASDIWHEIDQALKDVIKRLADVRSLIARQRDR